MAALHSQTTGGTAPPARLSHVRSGTWDWTLRRLLAVGDGATVVVSLAVALTLPGSRSGAGTRLVWGLAAVPLTIIVFKLYGLYDRDVKRISYSTVDDLPWLLHATMVSTLLVWLYSRWTPMNHLDFDEIVLFSAGLIVLGSTVRFTMRRVARDLVGFEQAVLVGTGTVSDALVRKLTAHPEYRVQVIGSLTGEGASDSTPTMSGLPILGAPAELDSIATRYGVSRVIFSSPDVDDNAVEPMLRRCRELALKVSILPKLSDVLGPAVEIDDVEGITVLGLNPPYLPRSSRAIKRVLDLVSATILLILFSPVLLLIAIAIKVDSCGPVFFAQERVGRGGRRFLLFKFRSMHADAEQRRAELLANSIDPNWLHLEVDPRITRVGHWLRRLSIDEIPQLWNVLRGEMSMVGPRPLIPAEDEMVQGWGRGRLDLTPGITGYWQVLGRTRIPFEEMVKLDYLYVMNWSLWEDARLMLKTLPVVIAGRGAN